MREIKFRQAIFKDGKFHHWHYWGYLPKDGYSSEDFVAPITIGQQSWNKTYEVKPSQQYTGLVDKTIITEIYEGDIGICTCHSKDCFPCKLKERDEIYWDNDVSAFCQKYHREPTCRRMKREPYQWCYLYGLENWEVIGNIYENPELLGVK